LAEIHSTDPLERLNGEIKRRTDVVGIFPNEAAIIRLVGAILLEQNDEWAIQRRCMRLETLGSIRDTATVSLPAVAAVHAANAAQELRSCTTPSDTIRVECPKRQPPPEQD
jgi:hypothetical protein